jgi:hypothetical protein
MKRQNYIFDDVVSGANLRERNFFHSAIPVNYSSEFWDVFEATTYLVNLFFIFLSLSKEILG